MSESRWRKTAMAASERAITLRAYYDGEQIRLDEPFELKPGTPLTVTVWPEEDSEREDWTRLSLRSLENAYGENEPEYSLDMIKRPNPEYEGT
jgi:hypothetical protein